jgi:hypothetical protein
MVMVRGNLPAAGRFRVSELTRYQRPPDLAPISAVATGHSGEARASNRFHDTWRLFVRDLV